MIVRKAVRLTLPENFAFTFRFRGEAPPTTLEFKVVDAGRQRLVATLAARRTADGLADDRGAALAARPCLGSRSGPRPARRGRHRDRDHGGEPGAGTLWIDDLVLEQREPVTPNGVVPQVTASSARPTRRPSGSSTTTALPRGGATSCRTHSGCASISGATASTAAWSSTGTRTTTPSPGASRSRSTEKPGSGSTSTEAGKGGRVYVYMPDAECALRASRPGAQQPGARLRHLRDGHRARRLLGVAEPVLLVRSRVTCRCGHYPKYFTACRRYWTVVGVDGGREEALVNEEGMVEVDRRRLLDRAVPVPAGGRAGHLARRRASRRRSRPAPCRSRRSPGASDGLRLDVTAFASGPATPAP